MKFACHCGATLIDIGDGHPHKARLIPDQNWNAILDGLDQIITTATRSRLRTEDGFVHQAMQTLMQPARAMYQCRDCGRIYINDYRGQLHSFAPEDSNTPREILRSAE